MKASGNSFVPSTSRHCTWPKGSLCEGELRQRGPEVCRNLSPSEQSLWFATKTRLKYKCFPTNSGGRRSQRIRTFQTSPKTVSPFSHTTNIKRASYQVKRQHELQGCSSPTKTTQEPTTQKHPPTTRHKCKPETLGPPPNIHCGLYSITGRVPPLAR